LPEQQAEEVLFQKGQASADEIFFEHFDAWNRPIPMSTIVWSSIFVFFTFPFFCNLTPICFLPGLVKDGI
jgi:hypothetical protein